MDAGLWAGVGCLVCVGTAVGFASWEDGRVANVVALTLVI